MVRRKSKTSYVYSSSQKNYKRQVGYRYERKVVSKSYKGSNKSHRKVTKRYIHHRSTSKGRFYWGDARPIPMGEIFRFDYRFEWAGDIESDDINIIAQKNRHRVAKFSRWAEFRQVIGKGKAKTSLIDWEAMREFYLEKIPQICTEIYDAAIKIFQSKYSRFIPTNTRKMLNDLIDSTTSYSVSLQDDTMPLIFYTGVPNTPYASIINRYSRQVNLQHQQGKNPPRGYYVHHGDPNAEHKFMQKAITNFHTSIQIAKGAVLARQKIPKYVFIHLVSEFKTMRVVV